MKFRDLSRKRDYIAICRGKLSITRFFAEKRRFRDLSRKIANFAISTPPRQTNAPDSKTRLPSNCKIFLTNWSLSLEREEMWPLFLTNINGHIEPILEHNHYCDDNVLNLKRHSGNISFVRPLDLLRFSCNQCFKKGQ